MLPNVWQITDIHQTNASSYELYVEAEERPMAMGKDGWWDIALQRFPAIPEFVLSITSQLFGILLFNSHFSLVKRSAPKKRLIGSCRILTRGKDTAPILTML